MKKYTLVIENVAKKQLSKLPTDVAKNLRVAIDSLTTDPRPRGSLKLMGRQGYRLRRGDYRIIYDIEKYEIIVSVLQVGHRKHVY